MWVFRRNQVVTSAPGGEDGNKGVGRHQAQEVQSKDARTFRTFRTHRTQRQTFRTYGTNGADARCRDTGPIRLE